MADKIVNSMTKKVENDVDLFLEWIKDNQNNCEHSFLLKKDLTIIPSLVEGVSRVQKFAVICIHCSLEKETNSKETCPQCLNPMPAKPRRAYKISEEGDDIRNYLENIRLWDRAFLYICERCGCEVVGRV